MEHIVSLVGILLSSLFGLLTSFRLVREGELGSMTTFGKAKRDRTGKIKVIKPGLVWMIPIMNGIKKAHIKRDSVHLDELNVTLKSGLSCHFSAFVSYHVSDTPEGLDLFLYQVEHPQELISQKLASSIREILQTKESISEITDAEISSKITEDLKKYLIDNMGVTLDACGLTSLTESAQSQAVTVTKAKVHFAKSLYGDEIQNIPAGVMEACFGAQPVTSSSVIKQPAQAPEKKNGLMSLLTETKEEDNETKN